MATILNNKKSTYSSPYCYYTVEYTDTLNRTETTVDITFKITSHLANSSSVLGTGGNRYLKAQLYLNGNWSDEQTLKTTSESWSGTANHTKTFTLTITNLSSSQTTISNVQFKVKSGASDQASGLNATSCSDITIPSGHQVPTISSYTMTEVNSNLNTILNDVIVEHLSKKRFTINYTTYDSATVSKVGIYNNIYPYTTTNFTQVDSDTVYFELDCSQFEFVKDDNNEIPIVTRIIDSEDTQGLSSPIAQSDTYTYIDYKLPTINESDIIVKRIGQTSGKVGITITGTIYNNTIGSLITPQKPTITYSYYEYPNGTVYTDTIPTENITLSDNTYSVSNYNIGSETTSATNYFDPEKSYRVSITVSDNFSKSGTNISFNSVSLSEPKSVPVGEALWTEYKDHVDFKKITRKEREVFPIELIHATTSSSITFSSTSDVKVNLDDDIIIGDNFSISNDYGILIGSDINTIKINAQVWFSSGFNAGDSYRIIIYKNNTKVAEAGGRVQNANAYETANINGKVIEVQENDVIYLYCRNATGSRGTISSDGELTFVTIEKVL